MGEAIHMAAFAELSPTSGEVQSFCIFSSRCVRPMI